MVLDEGPTVRVVGLELGVPGLSTPADLSSFDLQVAIPAPVAGLSTGPDGLRVLARPVPGSGELWVGGGLEQVREVKSYDPAGLAVRVDLPFDPPLVAKDGKMSVPSGPGVGIADVAELIKGAEPVKE